MITAHEYGLETIDERLRRINIVKTLALGTTLRTTAEWILSKMTDKQIENMFNENIDVQHILLDSHGYYWCDNKIGRSK